MMFETVDHHRELTVHIYEGVGEDGTGSMTMCGIELPVSPVTSYNIKRVDCQNCLRTLRSKTDRLINNDKDE